jgi:hypothetical protein
MNEVIEGKICVKCKEFKLLKEFGFHDKKKNRIKASCRVCFNKSEVDRQVKILAEWKDIVKSIYGEFRCQCCGCQVGWYRAGNGKSMNTLTLDHRTGNEAIECPPYDYLRVNYPTDENIALFESCDFGMLCSRCNRKLGPPEGRMERNEQEKAYINRGPI